MRLPEYVVKAFRLKQVTKRKIIYEETEAIPIEWLLDYGRKRTGDIRDILIIIDEWRKENEIVSII